MDTNIEIKARVLDLDQIRERVEKLSDTAAQLILQQDTFFHVPHGRLKLRVLSADSGELIYYEREDASQPKLSSYILSSTSDPAGLRAVLAASLGILGTVTKQRWLYMVGNTRIHLDDVDGLGTFLELEVVLQEGQNPEEGTSIAQDLMCQLEIDTGSLVEKAYVDLLMETRRLSALE
jgi:predicted adenylyl cyclase CyaB